MRNVVEKLRRTGKYMIKCRTWFFSEVFSSTLLQWLEKNSNSSVVLLLMNTTMSSLEMKQSSVGLQIMEKCIATYFGSMFLNYVFSEAFNISFFINCLKNWQRFYKEVVQYNSFHNGS